MRPVLYILFLLFSTVTLLSQQASDYFPNQTGFIWNYKATPLDSLNNNIDSLAFFRQDSFSVTADYEGKLASIVPTKSGPLETIPILPYNDSLFFHFTGPDGYEYFRVGVLEFFLLSLDSLGIDTTFSFVDFFRALEDWYSVYRFGSGVNQQYTLISIDTTISTYPLRFEYLGKRLDDEIINTEIGTLDCKKFLKTWKVSYVFPPPIGAVELVSTEDSIWIAPDNWVVMDIIPANYVDLTLFGIESFSIPGLKTEIIDDIVSVDETPNIPNKITLYQNYPNPFNPATTIRFTIPQNERGETQNVSLKVFDIIGNEIVILVNEESPAGSYKIEFQSAVGSRQLASGIYYYQLHSGNYIETKKMILLK